MDPTERLAGRQCGCSRCGSALRHHDREKITPGECGTGGSPTSTSTRLKPRPSKPPGMRSRPLCHLSDVGTQLQVAKTGASRATPVDTRTMNSPELRDYCLSFAGSEETLPFGPAVSGSRSTERCSPSRRSTPSRSGEPQVRARPRGGAARRARGHPSRISPQQAPLEHRELDGSMPDEAVRDMIEDSYDLVVSKLPRNHRDALGWRGGP